MLLGESLQLRHGHAAQRPVQLPHRERCSDREAGAGVDGGPLVLLQQIRGVILLVALRAQEGLAVGAKHRRNLFLLRLTRLALLLLLRGLGLGRREDLPFLRRVSVARVGRADVVEQELRLRSLCNRHHSRDGHLLLHRTTLGLEDLHEGFEPLVILANPPNALRHLHDTAALQLPLVIAEHDLPLEGAAFSGGGLVLRVTLVLLRGGRDGRRSLVRDAGFLQSLDDLGLLNTPGQRDAMELRQCLEAGDGDLGEGHRLGDVRRGPGLAAGDRLLDLVDEGLHVLAADVAAPVRPVVQQLVH
mmetsp:Transcript_33365/g.97203  ORF Transcript_33365/g.97203 Transcript_33365/m.97203 type:complete len:302 (+) Transcript_33365:765-1670(+)